MTQPVPPFDEQQIPPFDAGHPMIGDVKAWLTTDVLDTPHGQRMILTIRVPNATVTAVMAKQEADAWLRQIERTVERMSSLILPPGTSLPPFRSNGTPQ